MRETDTRLWRMLFRQVDAAYAEADVILYSPGVLCGGR